MFDWSALGAILIPNVGGWGVALTIPNKVPDGKDWYQLLRKPPWTPPGWVFGTAWTVLYTSMGYASYLVYKECGGITDTSVVTLALYGGELVLNWTWVSVFFRFHKLRLALYHIMVLDVAAVVCASSFYSVSSVAGYFMLLYLGWLSFAMCLTYTIYKLN